MEVPSGLVGTIYTHSNLGWMENPYFEKLDDFPYMHVEMGWICPMWPSAPLATKRAPIGKKPCRLAVPLITGERIGSFLHVVFSTFFRAHGVLFVACALVVIFRGWP